MRILAVHNYYQQKGGEAGSFSAETDLLQQYGHEVFKFTVHNDTINDMNRISLAKATIWNSKVYDALTKEIRRTYPHIVHFQNTFPLISPASYYAAKREGIPVVQTLRNYRLICPSATLFRSENVCEDCIDQFFPWPGVLHKCYRNNRIASLGVATMLGIHRAIKTWNTQVDVYISLSEFGKSKFIQGGLPSEKILVKPNFVNSDQGIGNGDGEYMLFVGRLSPEKGIHLLIEALRKLDGRFPFHIVGDGPLSPLVVEATKQIPNLKWHGNLIQDEVLDLMGKATSLIFPSGWYEGQPRTIIESFLKGTPVIAADLGVMKEIVTHGVTGFHFKSGEVESLLEMMHEIWSYPNIREQMRKNARAEYLSKFTGEKNYLQLIKIYEMAIALNR